MLSVAECRRVLQCVAARCNVLQCVAVCCSALQCAAVCCSMLQCVAECGSVLQRVAACCCLVQCVAVCCSVLQCVAVCCSVQMDTSRTGYFMSKRIRLCLLSHVTHMNESCHTYRYVTSHIWMHHFTHMHSSRFTIECAPQHTHANRQDRTERARGWVCVSNI